VKFCTAFGGTPFAAVNTSGYVPAVPAAGVPDRTFVTLLNVTPAGNVPVWVTVGVGLPVTVTVNEPGVPSVNVVLFAEVIVGAAGGFTTVSVKFCTAFGSTPLAAVNTIGYEPAVPAAGVPERTRVALLNVTPVGNVPV